MRPANRLEARMEAQQGCVKCSYGCRAPALRPPESRCGELVASITGLWTNRIPFGRQDGAQSTPKKDNQPKKNAKTHWDGSDHGKRAQPTEDTHVFRYAVQLGWAPTEKQRKRKAPCARSKVTPENQSATRASICLRVCFVFPCWV